MTFVDWIFGFGALIFVLASSMAQSRKIAQIKGSLREGAGAEGD